MGNRDQEESKTKQWNDGTANNSNHQQEASSTPKSLPSDSRIRAESPQTSEHNYRSGTQSRALVTTNDSAFYSLTKQSRNTSAQSLVPMQHQQSPTSPLIIPGNGIPVIRAPLHRTKPRSPMMSVTFTSMAFIILILSFYAASPITVQAAQKFNTYVAGKANIFVLPTATPNPTPTPTPVPYTYSGSSYNPAQGSNPGSAAIIAMIQQVFGSYAQGALNIAHCESGFDPNARNTIAIMGSHASGVFQILYPITWNSTSQSGSSPFDYTANIHAAYEIFHRDGNTWREWACRP